MQETLNTVLTREQSSPKANSSVLPGNTNIVDYKKPADKPLALLETLWFGLDYGSILTAYSLDQTVRQLGWDTILMNKPPKLWTSHYDDPDNIAGRFIYKNCKVQKICRTNEDLDEAVRDADAVIVGSDVMWNYNVCSKQTKTHYFLDYVPDDKKKLSYAASFGYKFVDPYRERAKTCARFLKRFDALSVGSYMNLDILQDRFGLDAEIVLDPVFLCDRTRFEEIAAEAPCIESETDDTFIFNYIKGGSKRKREFLLTGNEILTPNHYSPMRNFININTFPESKKMLGLDVAFHITVPDWLYYISHSEFVVTDDFYGVCFAIIFNKPFIFLESVNYDGMESVKALLCSLNLEERIVYLEDDFKKKEYLFRMPIRYKKVNNLLEALKEQSLSWLNSQLNGTELSDETAEPLDVPDDLEDEEETDAEAAPVTSPESDNREETK